MQNEINFADLYCSLTSFNLQFSLKKQNTGKLKMP